MLKPAQCRELTVSQHALALHIFLVLWKTHTSSVAAVCLEYLLFLCVFRSV
uniref:Uncharacterized protein n=1 Tax=Anguilla anguilla TaxID=7936 RepID=A0A0E9TRB5_ANGAN